MSSVRVARAVGFLTAAIALLAGCSSTRIEGTWMRPELAGTKITGTVFVVGAMGDETSRRLYEDAMAGKLAARGLSAVKSYDALEAPLGAGDSDSLVEAAKAKGAAYLLSSAIVGHGKKTVINSVPLSDVGVGAYRGGYRTRGYGSYGGWYSRSWISATTTVRQVDIYGVETVLVDVPNDRIEWTVRTRSAAGSSLAYDADDFSEAIVDALAKAQLVAVGD